MATYYIKTVVHYEYEVEADNDAEAEKEGWMYENYPMFASVYSVDVEEQEEDVSDWLSGDEVEVEE